MSEAYKSLVETLERHLSLAAEGRFTKASEKDSRKPVHGIADAIERLIEEKLKSATGASTVSKWIKLSEQEPEKYQGVLVYGMGRDNSGYTMGVEWVDSVYGLSMGETGITVSHWMPLPDPPDNNQS